MTAIYEIDLNLLADSNTFDINLNNKLYYPIAERFKIPHIYEISMKADLTHQNDLWILSGSVYATVQLKCVQSQALFDAAFNVPFHVLLSSHEIADDMLDVELLKGSKKVDIGEIAIQYLALEIPLNPMHSKLEPQLSNTPSFFEAEQTPDWKKALEKLKSSK